MIIHISLCLIGRSRNLRMRLVFGVSLLPDDSTQSQKLRVDFCPGPLGRAQSVFGKWFPGSTGDPPVPSGDPPDGTETTIRGNENGLFATWLRAVPVGGSPTGAGESPAPPIFKHALSDSDEPYETTADRCGCRLTEAEA